MGLQIWLPLNGDLHNQGLNDVVAINNGATIDNNGKIGKCYSFNGNDSYISLSSNKLYDIFKGGSQPFSISFWVYHADTTRAVLFGDYNLTGAINFNIELTVDHKIRFYWGGSPDKSFTPAITQAQWTHIALTYDGSKILFFKDGILQTDKYSNSLAVKNKTSGVFYLGRDSRTGTTVLNGRLNDFRIYDHALSIKEVEEISKGLVLHYLLNDTYNKIYDTSGYCNNGIITGNLTTITPSPRYDIATAFDGNSYIDSNMEINTTNSTISLWMNMSNISNKHILDARNSNGIGKQPIYSYADGHIQTGGSSNYVNSSAGLIETNKWIHLALVQSDNTLIIYKNGNLFQTLTCTNSSIIKPTICARYTHANIPVGQLSDFRIYATALTNKQIKELYNTSMQIDSIGNIYARELVE